MKQFLKLGFRVFLGSLIQLASSHSSYFLSESKGSPTPIKKRDSVPNIPEMFRLTNKKSQSKLCLLPGPGSWWSFQFEFHFIRVKRVIGETVYPTCGQDGKGTTEGKSKIMRKFMKKTET